MAFEASYPPPVTVPILSENSQGSAAAYMHDPSMYSLPSWHYRDYSGQEDEREERRAQFQERYTTDPKFAQAADQRIRNGHLPDQVMSDSTNATQDDILGNAEIVKDLRNQCINRYNFDPLAESA